MKKASITERLFNSMYRDYFSAQLFDGLNAGTSWRE